VALTTVQETRLALGIDDPDAHLTFRYPDESALDAAVAAMITRAVQWLASNADSSYYTGASPGPATAAIDGLFQGAEEYAAGHFLFPRLKIRKVTGTHWAIDQESSERFQELIDTELLTLATELVEPYLTGDLTADTSVYTTGSFHVSEGIERLEVMDPVTVQYEELLIEANAGLGSDPTGSLLP
jgi:hypothetical protein